MSLPWYSPSIYRTSTPTRCSYTLRRLAFPEYALVSSALPLVLILLLTAIPESPAAAEGFLIPPMLHHVSSESESHFHSLASSDPILLHSHSSGPFLDPATPGMYLRVYSAGGSESCSLTGLSVRLNWQASMGRWALRFWSSLVVWGVGVAAIGMAWSWLRWERGGESQYSTMSLCYLVSTEEHR